MNHQNLAALLEQSAELIESSERFEAIATRKLVRRYTGGADEIRIYEPDPDDPDDQQDIGKLVMFYAIAPDKGFVSVAAEGGYLKFEHKLDFRTFRRKFPEVESLAVVSESYVDPECRKQGIGTAIYEAAVREAARRGYAIAPHFVTKGGETSEHAKKVWDKLAEKFPSEGYILFGGQPRAADPAKPLGAAFESAAELIEASKPDSDSYLLDEVMPSISDDQFAAVVGLHGFTLMNDLTLDPRTQVLEGILQHQEMELSVGLQLRGSYSRDQDGEWQIQINPMDVESDEPLTAHGTFSFDPETDAVDLMKALARLLGELSDLEGPDEAREEDLDSPTSGDQEDPAPPTPPSPEGEEPPALNPEAPETEGPPRKAG